MSHPPQSGNSLGNETSCSYSYGFVIPVTIIFAVTAVLVLFENILICIAIVSSQLRQIKSNLFLVGLAVADMFTSITIIPLQILEMWYSPSWPLGRIGVDIYNSLWNFCLVVPFLTVLAITIDRYMVITRQSNMYQEFTARSVMGVLALIWTYSIILVLLLALSFNTPPDDEYVWNVPYKFYYPFLTAHVLLPLLIICYCYLKILATTRSTQRQLLQWQDSGKSTRYYEIRLTKTVGYVILALVVVWVPVLAMEVVYAVKSGNSCLVKQVGIISVLVTCTNGVVNPMIYSARSSQFQNVLKKMLKCTRT